MNWNSSDNKNYRGPIDRAFVSLTEPYERGYFVDDYLRSRGAELSDKNRRIVNSHIDQYSGRAPIKRSDLQAFLNGRISVG